MSPNRLKKNKKRSFSSSRTRYFLLFFLIVFIFSTTCTITLKLLNAYNTPNAEQTDTAPPEPAIPPPPPYKTIIVGQKDTLNRILKQEGLSPKTSNALLIAGKESKLLKRLAPGQTLRLLIQTDPITQETQLNVLELVINSHKSIIFTRTETAYKITIEEIPLITRTEIKTLKIVSSLSAALQNAGLPTNMSNKLNAALGGTFNFSRNLRPGDTINFKYEALYDGEKLLELGKVLAIRMQASGKLYEAVLYSETGSKRAYYNSKGQSFQAGFLRWPIAHGRISSHFSMHRHHPILGITRPHTGTDFAAPYGTPIRSTAKGIIIFAGQQGSYGRVVMIKHYNGYVTIYAHMSRFIKGLTKGTAVSQGQTIGYIGTSGLSEGPHVHYEIRVNGQFHDPMKIKLPGSSSIPTAEMKAFNAHVKASMIELGATA